MNVVFVFCSASQMFRAGCSFGHCLASLLEASFGVLGGFNSVTADHVVRLIGVGSDLEPDLPQYQ